jgi:hypothetical protein
MNRPIPQKPVPSRPAPHKPQAAPATKQSPKGLRDHEPPKRVERLLKVQDMECYQGKLILVQTSYNDSASYKAVDKNQKVHVFRGWEGLHEARKFAAANGYTGIIVESASWQRPQGGG